MKVILLVTLILMLICCKSQEKSCTRQEPHDYHKTMIDYNNNMNKETEKARKKYNKKIVR